MDPVKKNGESINDEETAVDVTLAIDLLLLAL